MTGNDGKPLHDAERALRRSLRHLDRGDYGKARDEANAATTVLEHVCDERGVDYPATGLYDDGGDE